MFVGYRETAKDESTDGTIIVTPYVVDVSVRGRIGTGERAIKPGIKSLL